MVYKSVILAITFLCTMSLSSCNLRPAYTDKIGGVNSQLAAIELEPIDTIDGAEFYYSLSSLLPKSNVIATKYLLKVRLSNTNFLSVIGKNSDVSRTILSQTVNYRLIDTNTDRELTSGQLRHMTSYSITSTAYGSYIDNERTMEDLSRQSANELLERLVLYFTNQSKKDRAKNEVLPITN